MAYRDTRDPRIEHLKALVAREPELLATRRQLRAQFDLVQEQADADGIAVAEAERWTDDAGGELARRRARLAQITAELVEIACREREIDDQLIALGHARIELATLEAASVRAMAGPLGERLRVLDRTIATVVADVELLDAVVTTAEAAHGLVASLERTRDATAALARLERLGLAIERLRTLDERWRDHGDLRQVQRELAAASNDLASDPRRATRALDELLSTVGVTLRERQRERDALERERRTVIAHAV